MEKKIKKLIKFSKTLLIGATVFFFTISFSACNNKELKFEPNVSDLGVWWWHSDLSDEYLEFAANNGVTEIYYSVAAGSLESNAKSFIKKAKEKDIDVYFLLGDYRWISDNSDLVSTLVRYTAYQEVANDDEKFMGIHMDVEPHQNPNFSTNRSEILQSYIDFIVNTSSSYTDISFSWDIPAWFNDKITYNGVQTELYKAVIEEADRVFIMSYRDSAEKMIAFSTVLEQVKYAKTLNKQIFLSAECNAIDEGGTVISYKNRGKDEMYLELNKLKDLTGYDDLGISIHHILSWFELKD